MKKVKVAVTGAAGQIGYALLFRIGAGDMFGPDTEIELNLLELDMAVPTLKGIVMELEDCAFPLVKSVQIASDPNVAFRDVDWALLVGAAPRKVGMERGDLLRINGGIFVEQGKALDAHAKPTCKILVVGNPCNTNAFIAKSFARNIPPKNFFALMMLDQKRAMNFLAQKAGVPVKDVGRVAVWGNHSVTQFPDFFNATIQRKAATDVVQEPDWFQSAFLTTAQQRGAVVIKTRGGSAAASAANATIETVKNLLCPTAPGDFFSLAVCSDGSYGIPEGVIFGFPVRVQGGEWEIVQGIRHNDFAKEKIQTSLKELLAEKEIVQEMLK